MHDAERFDDLQFEKRSRQPLKLRLAAAAQPVFDRLKRLVRFLLYCLYPENPFRAPEKLNKIAYLDGLRGFAALMVYFSHNEGAAHSPSSGTSISLPAGTNGEYYFAALPVVRLFFSAGSFFVAIFFIISGYVISLSPLKKLHAGQHTRLANDLGVSFPKRFVRLYIPVLGTTFCYMTSWHLFGIQSTLPGDVDVQNYGQEILTWIHNFLTQSFYFSDEAFRNDRYNSHLWTLPVEIRGSYTVYAILLVALAFHEWGTAARLWFELGLISYLIFLVDGWYLELFIVGMLLCDLKVLSDSDCLPRPLWRMYQFLKRGKGFIWYPLFAIGLFLASFPTGRTRQYENFGWIYGTLSRMNPPASSVVRRFILAWAALFFTVPIPHIRWLRAFFESRFCQYLGKISFCLYLIHGPVLRTVGVRVYAALGRYHANAMDRIPWWVNRAPVPDYGPVGMELNVLVAQLIIMPILFYLAGVATKMFDEPSVDIARALCNPSRFSQPSVAQEYASVRQETERTTSTAGGRSSYDAEQAWEQEQNEMAEIRAEGPLLGSTSGSSGRNSFASQSRSLLGHH